MADSGEHPSMLDYCSADTPHLRGAVTAVTRIRQRQALGRTRIAFKLAFGLPASLIGPALAATCVVPAEAIWARHPPVGWWGAFGLACLVLMPLLYWIEFRTQGRFLADEIRAQGTQVNELGILRTSSYGEWELRTQAAMLAMIIELLLFPPRLVISALAEYRERKQLGDIALNGAARVLTTLACAAGGVKVAALLEEGEEPARLLRILRFLVIQDWLGLSKDGKCVWLLSSVRPLVK